MVITEAMVCALHDAKLQIEYLHAKFQPTGSGEAVLARIRAALAGYYAANTPADVGAVDEPGTEL
jgi:hypothetical protein